VIIKKYQANTETEAIMLAKEELGKDAIVMNIKTISPKGIYKLFRKPFVEITAAIDEQSNVPVDKKEVILEKAVKKLNPNIIYEEEPQEPKTSVTVEPKENYTSAIEKKLNNLQDLLEKKLVENQTEEKTEKEEKNLVFIQLIYNQLIRNEVDEKYVNQILGEVENKIKNDASLDNNLASIYQKIILKLGQPQTISVEEGKTKFIFFVGPTGVGKTTTIAKIASSLKLSNKARVALLTSDTYRIAAVEQLRTYANILNIPMKVIYSPDEMKNCKEEYKEFNIVLIDTAGRSHKVKEQRDDIEKLIHSVDRELRETYLVLSATTKYADMIKITEAYSQITDYRLIFTKLDETTSIGNILNIKMLTNAELSYTTWGQNVPDDIGKLDTQNTAKQLLGGSE
jgi:flagellar biosynthesis protein FlhF